jgi:hypothetical protein
MGSTKQRIHIREIEQVERLVEKLTQGWFHRWAALETRSLSLAG